MATAQAMTSAQQSDLERAIERATSDGIMVLAQGRRKRDGARLFWTNSHSHLNGGHIVVWVRNRLVCNCRARQVCKHRAPVHMYLVNQAARAQARAEAIEEALWRELRRETVAAWGTATADSPKPLDDMRPIGIWK